MVVDVDWNIRDANGIADLQPQGRILLVDPNLAQEIKLYFYNYPGNIAQFTWYTGTFSYLQDTN